MTYFSDRSDAPVPKTAAAIAIILGMVISGCSTLDKLNPFSKSGSKDASASTKQDSSPAAKDAGPPSPFVSQSKSGYVRLEPIESGAAPNDQPISFTATQIRAVLAMLRTSQDNEPLFNEDELNEVAAPIATALSKASAREDVAFAVAGKHGALAAITQSAVTSGRVFYKNGALNFIFGEMRSKASDQLASTGFLGSFVLRDFPAGSRSSASRSAEVGAGGSVTYAANNRHDWVQIAAQGVPPPAAVVRAPAAPPGAQTQPGAPAVSPDAAGLDIERRLTVLKGLRDKGLITEQEYDDKRKDILKSL